MLRIVYKTNKTIYKTNKTTTGYINNKFYIACCCLDIKLKKLVNPNYNVVVLP